MVRGEATLSVWHLLITFRCLELYKLWVTLWGLHDADLCL